MTRLTVARAPALFMSAWLLLAALVPVPAARAVRPIKPHAPEFPGGAAWVNSIPFTVASLRRKRVIIVSFINTNTAHSVRTFPTLNRWWKKYGLEGLMIIGVHTPDFGFDRDPLQVRKAVKRYKLKFPVVIDSRRKIWDAYRNEGWPAHYLLDHKGRIIHDRIGEGGYAEFEEELLMALAKFNGYHPPRGYRIPKDPPLTSCGEATRGFYLGSRRGKKTSKINPRRARAIIKARDGEVGTTGPWRTELDSLRFNGRRNEFTHRATLIYQGAEVMSVMTRSGARPGKMYVKQDNLWLHGGNANKDVKWDDEDRSYIKVDESRMYYVARNRKPGLHEMVFFPMTRGVGISGFEFSDFCQSPQKKKKK